MFRNNSQQEHVAATRKAATYAHGLVILGPVQHGTPVRPGKHLLSSFGITQTIYMTDMEVTVPPVILQCYMKLGGFAATAKWKLAINEIEHLSADNAWVLSSCLNRCNS